MNVNIRPNIFLGSTLLFFSLFISILLAHPILAADEVVPTKHDSDKHRVTTLPSVTVVGEQPDTLANKEVVDRVLIEDLPSRGGNATELLYIVPGVQLPEAIDESRTGGEIIPPEVSISGGRATDNYYMFDGSSNNSLLDPDFKDPTHTSNIPGHSQQLFLMDHLIKDITVQRSNISARYGSFTGGVVEVESIDPAPEFQGEVSYRTTRSQWGEYFVAPEDEDDFVRSTTAEDQPKFTKHQTSATLHIPLSTKMGLLIDYSRLQSSIPLTHLTEKKVQHRRNENLFLKYVATPDRDTKITLSGTYAPYEGDYYLKNARNSDFSLTGGGYKLGGQLKKQTDFARIELNLNYLQSENSRQAPPTYWIWRTTASKPWGDLIDRPFSDEGGYGDIEKKQKNLSGSLHVQLAELTSGPISHQITAGLEAERVEASYDRTEDLTRYIGFKENSEVVCTEGSVDCIDGEQFAYFKNINRKDHARAEISNYDAYLEDELGYKRLLLRPGVRISYNDLQNNTDIGPRLATSYDLFGNGKTLLIGGYNRYYGTNLLTLKLEEEKLPLEVWRRPTTLDDMNRPQPWEESPRSSLAVYRLSELDTPYADELSLGVKQKLLGGDLELLYIDRDYKDQLITVVTPVSERETIDGIKYNNNEWSNQGRRNHEEVSLSWQRSWKKHFLLVNATWQETKSNSASYKDTFFEYENPEEVDAYNELVWYDGALVRRNELPVSNFNRPYIANLVYTVSLPHGFSFTNTTHYESRYRAVERVISGEVELPDGSLVEARDLENSYYKKITRRSILTFDWKLAWESLDWHGNQLEITLDILNVFNRRIPIGTRDREYRLGRQYWAGIRYQF